MKKKSMLGLAFIFFISALLAGDDAVKILPLEIPANRAAEPNTLWFDLARLQAVSDELTAGMLSGDIVLLKGHGSPPLATLGNMKKGKVKWGHKTVAGKSLAVKFSPADYVMLSEMILARKPQPGFMIAASNETTQEVLSSFAVAFGDFPDLAVQLNYPIKVSPGQALGRDIQVVLENRGSVAASNIGLQIVLSSDDAIPLRPASYSASYGEDILLQDGSETVPRLEPGQQVTVNFGGSLKLPENTPPGKHYLAAVADPENSINELSEENNTHPGYIMVDFPEPSAFNLELPETVLYFEPLGFGFKITHLDTVLSDGKDWKLCKMQPNIYHIKHVSWSDYFWEIDTYDRAVWEITGSDFCRKGGKARNLKIKVEVAGGSLITPPAHFTLKLATTRLRFEPGSKKFALLANDRPICHLPFWWVLKRESYLYQIRYILWQDFFWQVNIFKKEADRISGGKFGTADGTASKLPFVVTVEK